MFPDRCHRSRLGAPRALLQAFYLRTARSDSRRSGWSSAYCFTGFVGIGVDNATWDHSTCSKNRERLLERDIDAKLSNAALSQPRVKGLLSTDHFRSTARGSTLEHRPRVSGRKATRASRPRQGGRNREADFRAPTVPAPPPTASLYRYGLGERGQPLLHGHAFMEKRDGLGVDACLTEANGHAARFGISAGATTCSHAQAPELGDRARIRLAWLRSRHAAGRIETPIS
jgi:hypothetical protein